jgi:hypothetical protein
VRRSERYRLLATLLNNMANACFTVGIAAPVAAGVFYGQNISLDAIRHGIIFWGAAWAVLHVCGQLALWGVR